LITIARACGCVLALFVLLQTITFTAKAGSTSTRTARAIWSGPSSPVDSKCYAERPESKSGSMCDALSFVIMERLGVTRKPLRSTVTSESTDGSW